ncbi:LysR family transcriptional regulator [Megasphaera sp. AM44-1BH]|uniref:LysR family transcriptional regulator n=1 Tax=Megasphaera sp. AM44-1BH TaxID=2292358 RepID=UPI000E51D1E3|nr:LysR family transcriptional regulator [Megasphaera sp. AM44-1BH]RHA13361.1 LysR family transcriptional regulator [Megasphaera sp. AM44-1BH]
MHIHDIEAFLTVVQTRNISRAAEQLYVSQTAITHRLQNLEAELGVTLLERGRGIKEISLTPSGQDFMPIAHRWAALWKELDHFKEEGEKLSLSFGSVQYLNDFIFPPLFQKLLNHQPKIHLSLHTEHTAELYPLLERREIDVAIAWRNIKYPDILCTPWKKTSLVVLKSSTASDKGISTIDNTTLDPQDEIYVPWTPEFKNWHDDHWPGDIYSSPTLLTGAPLTLQVLKNSRRWSIVPLGMAQYAFSLGGFIYSYLSDPPAPLTAYIIQHKKPRPTTQRSLSIFFKYLQELSLNIDRQALIYKV